MNPILHNLTYTTVADAVIVYQLRSSLDHLVHELVILSGNAEKLKDSRKCTAPGFLDTHLCYAAWRSSYSSRASIGV